MQAHQFKAVAGGKYPQLCRLGPDLLDVCGSQLRLIISERPLEDSIRSLQKRCPHMDPARIEAHQRWLKAGLDDLRTKVPPPRQLVVRYEDLLEQPEREARRVAGFLNLKDRDMPCRIAKAVAPIHLYAHQRKKAESQTPS